MPKENKEKKLAIIKDRILGLIFIMVGIWMFMMLLKWDFDIVLWQLFVVVFLYLLIISHP
ncbi:hypothetical protein LCGC14_3146310 [marine sediment metagenome]|uniref:Uncharacterized protein n=1 Tax=marine sediment metagenome TaxID=412755 RepID=A0A0F8Y271_9ZZZZ